MRNSEKELYGYVVELRWWYSYEDKKHVHHAEYTQWIKRYNKIYHTKKVAEEAVKNMNLPSTYQYRIIPLFRLYLEEA